MENATFRSVHGALPSNGSISTSLPIGSPRKQRGMSRNISSGDASDDPSVKETEKSGFFRVFSPKKALARKAQAKKKQVLEDLVETLTPESMDAIGILPFEDGRNAVRGRVVTRRGNVTPLTMVPSELVREVEEESSAELDEVLVAKEVQTEKNIVLPALHNVHTPPRAVSPKNREGSTKRDKPPKIDFQASMDIGELFTSVLEDLPSNGKSKEVSPQEEEMIAMALEKSKADFQRFAPTSQNRKKRIPLQVLDETQSWTEREQRKVRERKGRAQRVESSRRSGQPDPSHEELRLIEEEQEREMIELALERSLAEAKRQEQQRHEPDFSSDADESPHRVPYTPDEVTSHRVPPNEDEAAQREEEMIRRAMEMSMHDF